MRAPASTCNEDLDALVALLAAAPRAELDTVGVDFNDSNFGLHDGIINLHSAFAFPQFPSHRAFGSRHAGVLEVVGGVDAQITLAYAFDPEVSQLMCCCCVAHVLPLSERLPRASFHVTFLPPCVQALVQKLNRHVHARGGPLPRLRRLSVCDSARARHEYRVGRGLLRVGKARR